MSKPFEKINETCRICLQQTSCQYSYAILGHITIEEIGATFSIPYLVFQITNEMIEEQTIHLLPYRVCWRCVELLKASYLFRVTYNKSAAVLKEYLGNFPQSLVKIDAPQYPTEALKNEVETVNGLEPLTIDDLEPASDVLEPPILDALVTDVETPFITSQEKFNPLHHCPICNDTFTNALKFRKHAQTEHTDIKSYIKRVPKIEKHVKFYTAGPRNFEPYFSKDPMSHMCPFCEMFLPQEHFPDHVATHKARDEFACDICKRVFGQLRALNVHKALHKKDLPFKCHVCKKGFMVERNLQYHMNVHTEDLPFKCEFCGKSFYSPVYLKRHLTEHTDVVPYKNKWRDKFKCKMCMRSFNSATEAEGHTCRPVKITFARRDNYRTCKTCWKRFENAQVLKTHHCVPRERPKQVKTYPIRKKLCSLCGKNVLNLTYHMVSHTGEKPYVCPTCGKRFAMMQVFKKHLRSHDTIKPFICALCGKGFRENTQLCAHEKTHAGVKKYACPVCNHMFLERSYMHRHLRNVHKAGKLADQSN